MGRRQEYAARIPAAVLGAGGAGCTRAELAAALGAPGEHDPEFTGALRACYARREVDFAAGYVVAPEAPAGMSRSEQVGRLLAAEHERQRRLSDDMLARQHRGVRARERGGAYPGKGAGDGPSGAAARGLGIYDRRPKDD